MQKRLIVMAISAAALSAPALADTANVTIYGVANLSADYISTGDAAAAGGARGVSKLVVSSNQSRIGFKGAEDLGAGLSAIWQIESLVNMDNAGGLLGGGRNTFAGLRSENLGTLMLGRHDTPYQMTTRKLDVFADTLADSRGVMGGGTSGGATLAAPESSRVGFDGRQPDSIVYISPTIGAFTGAFARANLNEARVATTGAGTVSSQSNLVSLAGMYSAGPIYASFAYEKHDFTAAGIGGAKTSEDSVKAGFGYTQEAFLVNVVVEKSSDDFGFFGAADNQLGHTSFYVGGKFKLTKGALKAAVARAGKTAAANTQAQQVSLGYDHNLSKRTIVYVLFTKLNNGNAARYGLAGNSSAGTANTTTSGPGADPSALSFGIRHVF